MDSKLRSDVRSVSVVHAYTREREREGFRHLFEVGGTIGEKIHLPAWVTRDWPGAALGGGTLADFSLKRSSTMLCSMHVKGMCSLQQ